MNSALWIAVVVPAILGSPSTQTIVEMPGDFLRVESGEWNKWLDERIEISWTRISLKNVLAGEFGPAQFAVDPTNALDTPITCDIADVSRRMALWRLSQQYGFKIRWAQIREPRVFLGLLETDHRKRQINGVTLTEVTHVMRSDYETYLDEKRRGQIKNEETIDGDIYYAIDVDRDLNFGYAAAHVNEVQRYKTTVPPESSTEKLIDARFVAEVKWIEVIGTRKASVVAIGPNPRWLVAIDIVSLEKPATPFTQKGRTVLAIHSPAKLFAVDGNEAVGKVYVFTLSGVMSEGRPSYRHAETKVNPPSFKK